MINDPTIKKLARQALPCPFCGQSLVARSFHQEQWLDHPDEYQEDCLIGSVQVYEDNLWKWNTREDVQHILANEGNQQ